eukprot:TRINITY_DN4567_c0_g1_i1.p1 TRINITY_DN4567_c0_g1~~TRINITY_DN4567_c0_g1_i1.p1  ORF type:complete len:832 (-),score=175.56 TRINITY_DN4567_c0_g1_i1:1164-3659(-)
MADDKLYKAARKGDITTVQKYLNKGIGVSAADGKGMTLLHHATRKGRIDMMNYLIECKCRLNTRDDLGMTALFTAALYKHLDAAELLIQNGADPEIPTANGIKFFDKAAQVWNTDVERDLRRKWKEIKDRPKAKGQVYDYHEPGTAAVKFGGRTIYVPDSTLAAQSATTTEQPPIAPVTNVNEILMSGGHAGSMIGGNGDDFDVNNNNSLSAGASGSSDPLCDETAEEIRKLEQSLLDLESADDPRMSLLSGFQPAPPSRAPSDVSTSFETNSIKIEQQRLRNLHQNLFQQQILQPHDLNQLTSLQHIHQVQQFQELEARKQNDYRETQNTDDLNSRAYESSTLSRRLNFTPIIENAMILKIPHLPVPSLFEYCDALFGLSSTFCSGNLGNLQLDQINCYLKPLASAIKQFLSFPEILLQHKSTPAQSALEVKLVKYIDVVKSSVVPLAAQLKQMQSSPDSLLRNRKACQQVLLNVINTAFEFYHNYILFLVFYLDPSTEGRQENEQLTKIFGDSVRDIGVGMKDVMVQMMDNQRKTANKTLEEVKNLNDHYTEKKKSIYKLIARRSSKMILIHMMDCEVRMRDNKKQEARVIHRGKIMYSLIRSIEGALLGAKKTDMPQTTKYVQSAAGQMRELIEESLLLEQKQLGEKDTVEIRTTVKEAIEQMSAAASRHNFKLSNILTENVFERITINHVLGLVTCLHGFFYDWEKINEEVGGRTLDDDLYLVKAEKPIFTQEEQYERMVGSVNKFVEGVAGLVKHVRSDLNQGLEMQPLADLLTFGAVYFKLFICVFLLKSFNMGRGGAKRQVEVGLAACLQGISSATGLVLEAHF